jgi:hypothetical protein
MLRRKSSFHAVLLACAVAPDAAAETMLSSVQLHEYCKAFQTAPSSSAGRVCAAYVGGFIEGLVVVGDARVEDSAAAGESWLERARRTRLGSHYVRKPTYCIDSSTPLEQIIRNIAAYAETRPPRDDVPANAMIRSALERFYSC